EKWEETLPDKEVRMALERLATNRRKMDGVWKKLRNVKGVAENHSVSHRHTQNGCAAASTTAVKTARSIAKIPTARGQAIDKSPAPDSGIADLRNRGHRFTICARELAKSACPDRRRSVVALLAGRSRDEQHGCGDQFSCRAARLPHSNKR